MNLYKTEKNTLFKKPSNLTFVPCTVSFVTTISILSELSTTLPLLNKLTLSAIFYDVLIFFLFHYDANIIIQALFLSIFEMME